MKTPELKPCPECERYIPVAAIKCRCGWTAPKADPSFCECAFAGCPERATLRVKGKTGWANVCVDHDLHIANLRSQAYCKSLFLDTAEKQRQWLLNRGKMPSVLKRNIERQREPGEDSPGDIGEAA